MEKFFKAFWCAVTMTALLAVVSAWTGVDPVWFIPGASAFSYLFGFDDAGKV